MAVEQVITRLNIFNSQEDFNANKEELGDNDISFVPVTLAKINSDGHLVFPNGSEFWIE